MRTLFRNAAILDVRRGDVSGGDVLVVDGAIAEIGNVRGGADETVDVGGRILMPGLVDGHVHIIAVTANFPWLVTQSPFYVMARAAHVMKAMLWRGFTTVRDAGGADFGIAQAQAEGHVAGPHVLFCGHALSPTGGHGDMRSPGQRGSDVTYETPSLGMVCDGVTAIRRAAREEIRRGANHIKIMASGGVSSPTDRIDSDQFSAEEIAAAVEEAAMANLYVMAHAYTARSVNRCLENGVRTVEHCNLMDENSCRLFTEHGAYCVPTLATYHALKVEGAQNGMAAQMLGKLDSVLERGAEAVAMAQRAGVRMVYGTDLLGDMHRHQLTEFTLRTDAVPAADLVRAATCNAADAFMRTGTFGEIVPGARADLLVSNRNPLEDIEVLTRPEENLAAIVQSGRFVKHTL